jgi:predicted nucleotidyltransferase
MLNPIYPTKLHKLATEAIVKYFSNDKRVTAIILTGSCTRGKATKDSCIDITLLISDSRDYHTIDEKFEKFYKTNKISRKLEKAGKFAHVDLNISDGNFKPGCQGWTTAPDEFELEIGNTLVYSIPLFERGDFLRKLKRKWLPYYNEKLRKQRLTMAKEFCLNNLHHIPSYVKRGLYFQSSQRLSNAIKEFLQALFIKHRKYPIAYDKWIEEQMVDILGLPELYPKLLSLLIIKDVKKDLVKNAHILEGLVDKYL